MHKENWYPHKLIKMKKLEIRTLEMIPKNNVNNSKKIGLYKYFNNNPNDNDVVAVGMKENICELGDRELKNS